MKRYTKRFLAPLSAMAVLLSGAAFVPAFVPPVGAEELVDSEALELPLKIGRRASPLGHYLAGLHAQNLTRSELASDFYGVTQSRFPSLNELSETRLGLLLQAGKIDEAVLFVKDVRALSPDSGQPNWVQFLSDFKRGRFDQAATAAEAMRSDERDVLLSTLATAWLSVAQRDGDGMDSALEKLDDLGGLEALTALNRALGYDILGEWALAESHFDAALGGASVPSLRLLDLAGSFFERRGQPERAKQLYEDYLKVSPSELVAQRGLDRIESGVVKTSGEVASAEQGLAEMLYQVAVMLFADRQDRIAMTFTNVAKYLRPEMPYAEVLTGQMLELVRRDDSVIGRELGPINRYSEAIEAYKRVPTDHPLHWRAQAAAANVFVLQEQYAAAEPTLQALTDTPEARFEALLDLGDLRRYSKRYEEAAESYEEALDQARADGITENLWRLHYYRAISYERSDAWDKAEAAFNTALELEPDQPQVLNYLAYSWVEQRRNFEQALDMLRLAVEQRPEDGYIVDSLGWVFYRLERFEEAVPHLEKAVQLRPNDAVINDHLGDVYWQVGRRNEARFQWRRALSFINEDTNEEADAELIKIKIERGIVDDVEMSVSAESGE